MVESLRSEMFDVLRSLSVRKRQGLLFVEGDRGSYELILSNGIIVEASRAGEPIVEALCERLVSGGYLAEEALDTIAEKGLTLKEFQHYLFQTRKVSQTDFAKVRRAYETDLVHSLRTLSSARFEFTPRIVDGSPDNVLSLAPGHLMLDFLEIESEQEAFTLETANGRSEGYLLRRVAAEAKVRFGSEDTLWTCLNEPITVEDLRWKALLSELEYREGLLSLLKQGAIVLSDGKREPAVMKGQPSSKGAPLVETQGEEGMLLGEDVSDVKHDAHELIDQFALLLDEGTLTNDVDLTLKPESSDISDFGEKSADVLEGSSPSVTGGEVRPNRRFRSKSRVSSVQRPSARKWREGNKIHFHVLNEMLLEPEGREGVGIALGFVFLILLGMLLPLQLNNWFAALSEFSSVSAFQHDTLELDP